LKIHFSISRKPLSFKWPHFQSGVTTRLVSNSGHMSHPSNSSEFDPQIIYGENYKSWIYSLHPPVSSSLVSQNIFSAQYSRTLPAYVSPSVWQTKLRNMCLYYVGVIVFPNFVTDGALS
jgi:hypothetical protein